MVEKVDAEMLEEITFHQIPEKPVSIHGLKDNQDVIPLKRW
jgi:hypothetical protein